MEIVFVFYMRDGQTMDPYRVYTRHRPEEDEIAEELDSKGNK
jgi:hypothetical protein